MPVNIRYEVSSPSIGVMQVPILALAFTIYISGVAIILYLRPRLMFSQAGSWKEFGVGRGETHTVLPFWLFAIFWAFISYGIALVMMSQFATLAISAFPESTQQGPSIQMAMPQQQMAMPQQQMAMPQQQMAMPQMTIQQQQQMLQPASFIKPVSSVLGINTNNPGYYILQNNGQNGLPQYVYYGTEPPKI